VQAPLLPRLMQTGTTLTDTPESGRVSGVAKVAVDTPLRTLFDYLPPVQGELLPGQRVVVPYARGRTVGVVFEVDTDSVLPATRLRSIEQVLEATPIWRADDLRLLRQVSAYYHHPIGQTVATAMPARLREGVPWQPPGSEYLRLSASGSTAGTTRAPALTRVLEYLRARDTPVRGDILRAEVPGAARSLRLLLERGWVEAETLATPLAGGAPTATAAPELTADQCAAVAAVLGRAAKHQVFVLDGVTGSGKTEVYLRLIDDMLARGLQTLLLVPEIALSDQVLHSLAARIPAPVALLHSGLTDSERAQHWWASGTGEARVVLGTRSAVWTPLCEPGLIIVDEEHDSSFKQQDGLRYSARDVAVLRASLLGIPAVLGSATPSLESWANAEAGRYRRLALPARVDARPPPRPELLDIRGQSLQGGLAPPLIRAIHETLNQKGQSLLFLNRRGYAPVLMCHLCGWNAGCERCDARLTWHRDDERLRCHHCLASRTVPVRCPGCGGDGLAAVGQGTERLTEALFGCFPTATILRVDADSVRARGTLQRALESIRSGAAQILVGTQMLAKGHHFPELALVGVVDADDRLFSSDFRAAERLAQTLLQVAGRAGRGRLPGRVLVQTHHPEHPLLQQLVQGGYPAFATEALRDRRGADLPPYRPLAMLRAESTSAEAPTAFLRAAAALAGSLPARVLGPIPSAMPRKAGRHRAQLWIEADQRRELHAMLRLWLPQIEQLPAQRKVRWALDVDPTEVL
jgi:primosomal protein N' (replication factor Y) (superfamily II helicase)